MTRLFGDEQSLIRLITLRGPARGLRFKLDLVKRIESAYWLGYYDLKILQALSNIVQPGWTVWDCGVYIGFYTAFFARSVGPSGHVAAFEPDPRNLGRAKANIELNHFENVQFVQAAIGVSSQEVDFLLSDNSNSHLPDVYVGKSISEYKHRERVDGTIKVRCISLDEAFDDATIPHPNLIKLDIEGAEKEALHHLKRLVHSQHPIIVLELHNPDCDLAAWNFATQEGYSLRSMDTGSSVKNREDVQGTLLCLPL